MVSVSGYESRIEIIVSDNASTDDTTDIIRSFQTKYPWIRYCRNDSNIGAEENFYHLFTLAAGDYVWLIGDDDKLEKKAVAIIIKQIDAGYNLIICNYSIWSKDFSYMKKANGFRFACNEAFNNPDKLIKRIGYYMGYISIIIIKKDVFFKCPVSEYLYYMEYCFPQLYAAYSGIYPHCNAIYLSSPLVCNRSDNYRDIDWCKIYVVGMSKIFESLLKKGYSKNSISSAKHEVLRSIIIPGIIGHKLNNWYLPNDINRVVFRHYKKNWLFWIVGLPVLYTPVFLLRLAKKVKNLLL